MFFPSGSSDNPKPTSAEGASFPDGWMGGWVGGDQKGPSIFKYIYKLDTLIPNMVSKIVYGH